MPRSTAGMSRCVYRASGLNSSLRSYTPVRATWNTQCLNQDCVSERERDCYLRCRGGFVILSETLCKHIAAFLPSCASIHLTSVDAKTCLGPLIPSSVNGGSVFPFFKPWIFSLSLHISRGDEIWQGILKLFAATHLFPLFKKKKKKRKKFALQIYFMSTDLMFNCYLHYAIMKHQVYLLECISELFTTQKT